MFEMSDSAQQRGESESLGPDSVNRRLFGLVVLSIILGFGHHLDHIVRGNHVGWPLIPEVTVFTYTLTIYPLIMIGIYITWTERVGAGYWSVFFAAIFLVVTVTHFGPWAVEPPQNILGPYENVIVGYVALAWLLGFIASLLVATVYAVHRWLVDLSSDPVTVGDSTSTTDSE